MSKIAVSLLAVSSLAGVANAQFNTYPVDGQLVFQVWNGASWSNSVNATAGSQVEYRVVVNYVGASTNVSALGAVLYSPIFSNADNTDGGNGLDTNVNLVPDSGNGFSAGGTLLNQFDGNNPNSRPNADAGGTANGYGRVNFGLTGMAPATLNRLTQFRHGGGAPVNGAPAGSWIRLSGSSVTNWPIFPVSAAQATAANINNIKRGVSANQQAAIVGGNPNTFHTPGTQGVVIFRGALLLSGDTAVREIVMTSEARFLDRDGGAANGDDDRFMTWQTSSGDNGSLKTGVEFIPATISIPSPASIALMGLGGLLVARRRRA